MFFVLTVLSNKKFNACVHEFFCESEELPRSATARQKRLAYVYPGPIQYWGPTEVCDQPTKTLALEQE